MRTVLKTWPNQPFIYPKQLLAREEGTASEENPQLGRSRFGYLLYMCNCVYVVSRMSFISCESESVKSFNASSGGIF